MATASTQWRINIITILIYYTVRDIQKITRVAMMSFLLWQWSFWSSTWSARQQSTRAENSNQTPSSERDRASGPADCDNTVTGRRGGSLHTELSTLRVDVIKPAHEREEWGAFRISLTFKNTGWKVTCLRLRCLFCRTDRLFIYFFFLFESSAPERSWLKGSCPLAISEAY